MKIDVTIPLCGMPGEGHKRGWPPLIRIDETVRKKIDSLLGGKL